jgi:hypothetical protein
MNRQLIACIIGMLCLAPAVVLAQTDEDEPQPLKATKYSGTFGVGGGVSPYWMFLRSDDMNAAITEKGFPAVSNKGMFLLGGHGYAYIMLIPNLRVGGLGAGGSISVEETRPGNAGTPDMFARTSIATGFGGVTLEYVIPIKRLQFAVGGMIGAGSYTLAFTSLYKQDWTWKSIAPSTTAGNYQHTLTCPFFAYQPTVSMEYYLSPFTILGVSGGYFGAAGNTWTLDDAFEVNEMPDIRFGGAFVKLGLTFGLFIPE